MNIDMKAVLLGNAVRAYLAGRGVGSKTPVAYLYNGVQLPALPEWDKETYPYATIVGIALGSNEFNYQLIYSDVQCGRVDSWTSGVRFASDNHTGAYISRVCYNSTPDKWEAPTTNDSGDPFLVPCPAVWANYDVLDKIDGGVLLTASDPIPVYE